MLVEKLNDDMRTGGLIYMNVVSSISDLVYDFRIIEYLRQIISCEINNE